MVQGFGLSVGQRGVALDVANGNSGRSLTSACLAEPVSRREKTSVPPVLCSSNERNCRPAMIRQTAASKPAVAPPLSHQRIMIGLGIPWAAENTNDEPEPE